jgi:hypothetical protein
LLSHDNLEQLERWHDGVFAFLAFHPKGDKPIVDYLLEGTLADDSGQRVLVFFTLNCDARWPKPICPSDFGDWIGVEQSSDVSHQIIALLFKDQTAPPLPGILFFERFSITEPVFASLAGLHETSRIRETIRLLCSVADRCSRDNGDERSGRFADHLSRCLALQDREYARANGKSWQEWCIAVFQRLWKSRQDLVSAASLLKK